MHRSIVLRIALPLLLVVAPVASQAQQSGFSDPPRRSVQHAPAQTVADQPTVVVDKTSGRYLQSVGKRVADRPLACPPKRSKSSSIR